MIILDLSNAVYSRMVREFSRESVTEDLMRHLVLDTIQRHNGRFKHDFGRLVIATDGKDYWRRAHFPYYKAGRKKIREKSPLDWPSIMTALSKIRDEVAASFSYPVINIPEAEADDVIATLVMTNPSEPIMILSGDHDFKQLQNSGIHRNLKQYDINQKKFVTVSDGLLYLKEHIIRGDAGDGIPNILSEDNCMVMGIRQKSIRAEKLETWMPLPFESFCDARMMRNVRRNQELIDLRQIPQTLTEEISEAYRKQLEKTPEKPFNYLYKHGMSKLMESVGDFS